jgi:hypothetical protein
MRKKSRQIRTEHTHAEKKKKCRKKSKVVGAARLQPKAPAASAHSTPCRALSGPVGVGTLVLLRILRGGMSGNVDVYSGCTFWVASSHVGSAGSNK